MKAVAILVLLAAVGVPIRKGSSDPASPVQLRPSTGPRKSSSEGLAIIVNRRNPVANVTLGQLREILFGEKKWWSSKHQVTLASMRRGTPERQAVLRTIYQMNERDFGAYFLFEVFRGELSSSPTILENPTEVKKFIATTPGAVGYVRASDVDDSVKVLRVNGLLPGDDGYPVRLSSRPTKVASELEPKDRERPLPSASPGR